MSCQKSISSSDKIMHADKDFETEKTITGNFDRIEVSTGIEAEIIKSEEERVIIYAPKHAMDKVYAEIEGGALIIKIKSGIHLKNTGSVRAKIFAKDFSGIQANSSASIHIKDKFLQDETEIEVSSSASIHGNLEANKMRIETSSSGTFSGKIWAINLTSSSSSSGSVDVKGKTKNVTAEVSSGGSFLGKNLIADHAELDASSGGNITIAITESLNAEASSGGSIRYIKKGEFKNLNQEAASGGSISEIK